MSGNHEGGRKAYRTTIKRHGKDFMRRIGSLGGQKSRGGGFVKGSQFASEMGAIGGRISRKGKR